MKHTDKLEIGPGKNPLGAGWTSVDVKARPGVKFIGNWGKPPLPFKPGSFSIIYASHVLEHVPWYRTQEALKEALRILKPGGKLEVWVPDFDIIVKGFQSKKCMDRWRKFNPKGDPMQWVNGRLFAYGTSENWHKAVFTAESLTACLGAAGFKSITRLKKPRGYDHGAINLGFEAVK